MEETALEMGINKGEEIDIDKNREKDRNKGDDRKKESDKKRDNEKKGENNDIVLDLETEIDQNLETEAKNIDSNERERGQDREKERKLFILKIILIKELEIPISRDNLNKLLRKISPKRKTEQTFIIRMKANLIKTKQQIKKQEKVNLYLLPGKIMLDLKIAGVKKKSQESDPLILTNIKF